MGRIAPRYWYAVNVEAATDSGAAESDTGRTVRGWCTSKFDNPKALLYIDHPVVHVSWYEAQAGRKSPLATENLLENTGRVGH